MSLLILFCLLSLNCSSAPTSNSKIKVVAIIDTGLDLTDPRFQRVLCKNGHKDYSNEGIADHIGHGTHVFGSIMRNAPDHGWCAVIVKVFGNNEVHNKIAWEEGFWYINKLKPDYVNLSSGSTDELSFERYIIFNNPNTKFIAAMGNYGKDLSKWERGFYPAKYDFPNVVRIGALSMSGHVWEKSNYGLPNIRWEMGVNIYSDLPANSMGYMTGTSMATSIATGRILSEEIQ